MEIYQASENYKTLSNIDIDKNLTDWYVRYEDELSGWVIERAIDGVIPSFVDISVFDSYYCRIEKQRGGIRIFKTLDAAANAIKQIGQDSFEVCL